MSTHDQRIKKIEQRVALNEEDKEPIFFECMINPWMPEEKADVLAKHPECDFFYKHMLPHDHPYRPAEPDRPILRTLNGTRYGGRKLSPKDRKEYLAQERPLSPAEEALKDEQIQRLRDYMNESNGLPPRPDKIVEPPQFADDSENPWTDEEKAAVLAKHPTCDFFYKARRGQRYVNGLDPAQQTLDGTCYLAEKKRPWCTYNREDAKRFQKK